MWDDEGRIKRWITDDLYVDENRKRGCSGCCKREYTELEKEKIFVKNMNTFNTLLYDDLDARSRAIANWKRLRLMIMLMRLGDDTENKKRRHKTFLKLMGEDPDDDEKTPSCAERFAPYILNPKSWYIVTWEILLGVVYLICYIIDPVVFAFNFEPLYDSGLNRFQRILTTLLMIDLIRLPCTGILKAEKFEVPKKTEDKHEDELKSRIARRLKSDNSQNMGLIGSIDDPILVRNIWKLLWKNLKGPFIYSALANIPIFTYEIYNGMHTSEEWVLQMSEDKLYVIFMLLKILRLYHLSAFKRTLIRLKGMLSDYFYTKKYTLGLM